MNLIKTNLLFTLIMLVIFIYILAWGFENLDEKFRFIFVISLFFGMFLAFNIGANDVANSFGTSVGSGVLSLKSALLIAAVFEISGAILVSSSVTSTIKTEIIDIKTISITQKEYILIMLSALIASSFWIFLANFKTYPISTTHCVIGGIIGSALAFGVASFNQLVVWQRVGEIVVSWCLSPIFSGVLSYLIYTNIKIYIFNKNENISKKLDKIDRKKSKFIDKNSSNLDDKALAKIKKFENKKLKLSSSSNLKLAFVLIGTASFFIIAGLVIFKGLSYLNLNKFFVLSTLILASVVVWVILSIVAQNLQARNLEKSTFSMFSLLQIFSACAFAFSHGSNDIANAIAPFMAILDALHKNTTSMNSPLIVASFAFCLAMGLWFMGSKVIKTVGKNITHIHPASGFSAEISASAVIMCATILGLPVSSTHILIGAVIGIGMVNKDANWKLLRSVWVAWAITIPFAAILSGICFLIMRNLI
ncbi:MAG: inorganic phosphate transporter [Campylobacter sp.]|nr:inorganic phosphate transporter [Campylobacter sp.]